MKKKKPLYIYTKRSVSFDTETMFTLDGVEDTDGPNQIQSSEEESDTDGNILYITLKIIVLCPYSQFIWI